jgi:hypothetical protein
MARKRAPAYLEARRARERKLYATNELWRKRKKESVKRAYWSAKRIHPLWL